MGVLAKLQSDTWDHTVALWFRADEGLTTTPSVFKPW
jgi:hypothetical protein